MENSGRFVLYYNIYFFTKNQRQNTVQNNRSCVTCYIISTAYTLIALDQSVHEDSLSYCKLNFITTLKLQE